MTGSVLASWIGKTSRSDDHLIFDGDEVLKCRTLKRRPECLRWDRVRVDAIDDIPSDRGHQESVFLVIVRSDTLHGPTSRSMVGHPIARLVRLTGPSHSKECRERFEAIFQKEDEEKAMKEAADAAATSAALQDEAATSSMNPPTTTVAGADPMFFF